LDQLKMLYLARNSLTGSIPTEIGALKHLTYLGLQHNKLTGTIPALHMGGLLRLRSFYFEENNLIGIVRRIEPLCGLMQEGRLKYLTADCRTLVPWKKPGIICACCSKCYIG